MRDEGRKMKVGGNEEKCEGGRMIEEGGVRAGRAGL
jgi:hypothetical protein